MHSFKSYLSTLALALIWLYLSSNIFALTSPTVFKGDLNQSPYNTQAQVISGDSFTIIRGSTQIVTPYTGLTAAHVVFDEDRLRFYSSPRITQNLPMGDSSYEPGGYVSVLGWSEYASRVSEEDSMETFNVINTDIAAWYSSEPIGPYFGSLHQSEHYPIPLLTLSNHKMLLGYPRDRDYIPLANFGLLHTLDGGEQSLALLTDNGTADAYGMAWHLYTSTYFRAISGNSGGPIVVETSENHWAAAALIIASSPAKSIFRAIDTEAINLLDQAATNAGFNNWQTPQAPIFIKQSKDSAFYPGNECQLIALSTLDENTSFQWYKNGTAIEGANSFTLCLSPYTASDAGTYFVRATNSQGSSDSDIIKVTTHTGIQILNTLPDLYLKDHDSRKVSLETSESYNNITWYKDGQALDISTYALNLDNIREKDEGAYYGIVESEYGSATSNTFQLYTYGFDWDENQSFYGDIGTTKTISPDFHSCGTSNFQWFFEDSPIEGATSHKLELPITNVSQSGTYTLHMTVEEDDSNEFLSYSFELEVLNPYVDWIAEYSDISDIEPASDPDNDNIPNILEFYLGLNPTQISILPLKIEANTLHLPYNQQRWHTDNSDFPIRIRLSRNLINWNTYSFDISDDNGIATLDLDLDTYNRCFFQLFYDE